MGGFRIDRYIILGCWLFIAFQRNMTNAFQMLCWKGGWGGGGGKDMLGIDLIIFLIPAIFVSTLGLIETKAM